MMAASGKSVEELERELRGLAAEATPGGWKPSLLATGYVLAADDVDVVASVVEYREDGSVGNVFPNAGANLKWIAAASPDAVTEILDENARLRAELKRAHAEVGTWADALDRAGFERNFLAGELAAREGGDVQSWNWKAGEAWDRKRKAGKEEV